VPASFVRETALVLCGLLAVLGPGSQAEAQDPPGGVLEQPFRDLGVIRDKAPEVLRKGLDDPYGPLGDCQSLADEIAVLDAALGPDIDQRAKDGKGAGVAGDLISGVIGLPFRGVVRQISGAAKRDRELRAAILSGMVRRAYVKGARQGMGCPAIAPVQPPG
jgi:hypothetical protein